MMTERPIAMSNPPVLTQSASDLSPSPVKPGVTESERLNWWEYATFTLVHGVSSALLGLLTLPGLHWFGRVLGTIEWLINYKRRRRFATTLRQVLGREATGAERRRWTREYFTRSRCDKLFYLIFDRIPRAKAMTLLSIGNQELLDRGLSRGRGVYMAMSHHGSLHVASLLMALCGYKTAGVRDRREGAMRRYIQERFDRRYPEFTRMRILFADSYPRDIYRCLSDGYLLYSTMDVSRVRQPNQKTEEVTIFGETRPFPSGPLRIAYRCRAPVLQAFVMPENGFRYRAEIAGMLIDPDVSTDEDSAVAEAMKSYATNVESYVRAAPSLLTRV